MDPNQTLEDLISALNEPDGERASVLCADLAQWLNRGGFMPDPNLLSELFGALADTCEEFL